MRLHSPSGNKDTAWNYIILAIALVFTSVSLHASLEGFKTARRDMSFWEAVKFTKDPTIIIVLLSDVGDVLGLLVAFVGVFLISGASAAQYFL